MGNSVQSVSSGAPEKKSTNHTINLLRFVFSLVIVSFHLFNVSGILPDDEVKRFYFYHGNSAVEFFFLVSGFLMAVSAERQQAMGVGDIGQAGLRFILRKIRSVIVPMYCTWILAFALLQAFTDGITGRQVLSNLVRSVYELLFLRNAGFKGYYVMGPTWYISAMLLTMTVCYPLLLKYKNSYLYCIAPITAAILLGYLNHEYTSLVNTNLFIGILYKCQIRSIGVINLGVVLYAVYRKFRTVSMTRLGTALLSVIEIGCYLYAVYYMCSKSKTATPVNRDVYALAALSFAVLITFSQRTWLAAATGRFPGVCAYLNKLSLYLYLSHACICKTLIPLVAERFGVGKMTYCIGMLLFFATAYIVMLLSHIARKALPAVKKLLVA